MEIVFRANAKPSDEHQGIVEAWPWPTPRNKPQPVSALKPENVRQETVFRLLPDDQLECGIRNCIEFGLELNDAQRAFIKANPEKFQ